MKYSIGIDIGGTNLRLALVDNKGNVENFVKFKTPRDHKEILNIVANYLKNISKSYLGVGLAIASPVDLNSGFVRWSEKFKYPKNFNIQKNIKNMCRKNVFIDNDLNVSALSEVMFGPLNNINNAIAITVSTGIGSGIVIDKTIYRGKGNGAGEIGHTPLNINSKMKCNLGHVGDWESLASAKSLEHRYYLLSGIKAEAKEIVKLAKLNNLIAKKSLKETAYYISVGLSGVINSFSPDVILICGDFFNEAWKLYKTDIIKEIKKKIVVPMPSFVKSKLGDKAGVIGAASLVFNS